MSPEMPKKLDVLPDNWKDVTDREKNNKREFLHGRPVRNQARDILVCVRFSGYYELLCSTHTFLEVLRCQDTFFAVAFAMDWLKGPEIVLSFPLIKLQDVS